MLYIFFYEMDGSCLTRLLFMNTRLCIHPCMWQESAGSLFFFKVKNDLSNGYQRLGGQAERAKIEQWI